MLCGGERVGDGLETSGGACALEAEADEGARDVFGGVEDLVDALFSAWADLLWIRHGLERCQVLGLDGDSTAPAATIIAPCRPAQRAPTCATPA